MTRVTIDSEAISREVRELMETKCEEEAAREISWKHLKNVDSALLQSALEVFKKKFGRTPTAAARAPGRVNLIGDHVDYCDGFVLPVALQFSTIIVGGYNDGTNCNVVSVTSSGELLETQFHSCSVKPGEPSWANYIKGVVAHFPVEVKSFDAVIVSNVPVGAGLSSSAAVEVAMFTFLEDLTDTTICTKKKALLCQKAEHTFPVMPCGIMDQFIAVMGKKDGALLLDCRSLESTHIPITSSEVSILVTNSNIKHQLTGSEYPLRRSQCEQAIVLLGKVSMRDLTDEDLCNLKQLNAEDDIIKRTQHVVTEICRTVEAAKCMKEGDFKRVGELFYESHESLSSLMEVSCPEIDALIDINKLVKGVLGARMTGGGFGGCTVSLVLKHEVENLKKQIRSRFKGNPVFFECQPCDGAQIILLT